MDALAEERIAELPTKALDAEIGELASHIAAATARWLLLIAEFERRNGHWGSGFSDCASWLSWRCSLSPRAAREHRRVARALSGMPKVTAAFLRGELTYSKVRVRSRIARRHNEEALLTHAQHATAAQLERISRAYRGTLSVEEERRAHYERRLIYRWQDDGRLYVSGYLSPEEGALFVRALEAARDAAFCAASDAEGPREPPALEPRRASNADALVAMAEASLASEGIRSGGDRYQLLVHVEDGHAQLDDGPALADETARRLSCDASVVAVREGDGEPLSVGRKTRTIPGPIRRALRARDRSCRVPGCQNHRFTDAHHIRHWQDGGETKVQNLVTLCRRHHRLLHEHGYTIERLAGGRFLFHRPDGTQIADCPAAPRSHPRRVVTLNGRRRLEIGPDTCFPRSAGERMDLDLTIWNLCQLDERARDGPLIPR